LRPFNGQQTSGYFNAIYQTILGDTRHTLRTGLSFQYDAIEEEIGENNYSRDEYVPGAFMEYTYGLNEGFSLVAGIRVDHHNQFGWFATPRLHVRYAPDEYWVFRVSAGRGARTANIFAENYGLLASSRELIIETDGNSDTPYGLDQEVAWNFGVNVSRDFKIGYRSGFFSLDYYFTDFENQIVVDVDRSSTQAFFYNLDGRSYAHSFQAQVDYEITPRLDVRVAYRWQDVQTTFSGVQRFKPLVSKHRAFINMAYETRSNWKFDGTLNWQGTKRLPITSDSPAEFQLDEKSPNFLLFNTQITKVWGQKYEVYIGAENLFNFRQDNPIVSADDPFNDYFDSSMVWGPIFGRNIYLGFRYRIL
jgi:outer membrane receptor for ferrienterochelin and colicin